MALTRKRFTAGLLIAAFSVGALLMLFTERGSALNDLGALLGLASLTIVSYVVFYFAKKRAPPVAAPPDFALDARFVAHLRVRLSPLATQDGEAPAVHFTLGARRYYLLLGSEAFSVRLREDSAAPGRFDAQFLRPEVALPRFPEGTTFRLLDGTQVVAEGSVAQHVVNA